MMGPSGRRRTGIFLLLAPLGGLVLFAFLLPLGMLVWRAVDNTELATALPETTRLLRSWDGAGLPPEPVFAALAAELPKAADNQTLGLLSRRLNFEQLGMRALLLRASRVAQGFRAPYAEAFQALDPRWGEPELWQLLRRNALPVTPLYMLRAVDLTLSAGGGIVAMAGDEAIFRELFLRTIWIALVVTVLCLVIGYPVAWYLSMQSGRRARMLLLLLLLPFWTSVLVRTTAWFILLQREGVANSALRLLGLVEEPLTLIFTRTAVYLAMVHVMLPFMVLPLYGAMRRIDPVLLKAAASLGAPGWTQFRRIYLPLSLPGIAAGSLMVFTISIGFYITPALVGGNRDQMISTFIAFFVNQQVNWGMAAALGLLLLVLVGTMLYLLQRIVGARVLQAGRGAG
ncbi:MAG: ABC transporter permease [Alphaproteobacteria bacterium]|nr:ABC transporter permease [Alphaproteobacteria bacterium]